MKRGTYVRLTTSRRWTLVDIVHRPLKNTAKSRRNPRFATPPLTCMFSHVETKRIISRAVTNPVHRRWVVDMSTKCPPPTLQPNGQPIEPTEATP